MKSLNFQNLQYYQKSFQLVFEVIKKIFPFQSKREFLKFQKQYEQYYKNLENLNQDDKFFFQYLQEFLMLLKNSHTRLGSYPTKKFFKPNNYNIILLGQKFYLKRKNKIIGEVLLIDNLKPQQVLTEWSKRMPRFQAMFFLLTSYEKKPVSIKLKTKQGVKQIILKRDKIKPSPPDKIIQSKIFKNKIGYLKIRSWSGDSTKMLLDKEIKRFLKNRVRVLIIDVRDNEGGDASIAQHLASHFFNKKVLFSIIKRRISESDFKLKNFYSYVEPRKPYFDNPIILLINNACFSSNEYFIAGLKDNKRALLIGEKTRGGSGNPKKFIIPYKNSYFELFVSTWIYYRPNRKILEGKGIRPHITIRFTLKGLLKNKDEILIKALEEARKMIKKSK